jgi:hypothetical protein
VLQVVSSEFVKRSGPSIGGGQVEEIKGSHEIGGSQSESPKVGCSKSRSCKITRSDDSHWIQRMRGPLDQKPHHVSHLRRFRG